MKHKKTKKYVTAPLLPLVFCFIIGILFSAYPIPFLAKVITATILIIIGFLVKELALKNLTICLLIIIIGMQYASDYNFKHSNHISKLFADKTSIQNKIKAQIITAPTKKNGGYVFTANLLELNNLPVKGRVICYTFADSLQYNQTIEALMRIEPFTYTNPGEPMWATAFENARISARANILFVYQAEQEEGKQSLKTRFMRLIISFKEKLYQQIDSKFINYPEFIKAIITGNTSLLYNYNEDNIVSSHAHYQQAGVLHLLAVSGLHTGLIYLVIFTVLNFFNRYLAKVGSIPILFIFAALCDFSPSVMRASLMITIFIISNLLQRRQNFWQIISLTALIILVVNPNQIYSVGFLLSFVCIIALHCIGMLVKSVKGNVFIEKIITPFLASALISVFLAPFSFYFFNSVNFNSIISNILLIPFFSLILISTLMLLAMPQSTFLFKYSIHSLDALIYLFGKCLAFFARFDFIYYYSINKAQFIILLFALGFIVLSFYAKKKRLAVQLFVSLLLISSIFLFNIGASKHSQVIFFNTGTSDSFLISTKERENIVIDCADIVNSKAQIESNLISYCLKNRIKRIDYLIITHPDSDHMGGLQSLLTKFQISNLVINQVTQNDSLFQHTIKLKNKKIDTIICLQDTCSIKLKGSTLKFLHPDKDYLFSDVNNGSTVVKWTESDFDFLFTGDIESPTEAWLSARYPNELQAEVLKVPHHGSKTSSSEEFLANVSPQIAIISASERNRFNFPNKQTLTRLKQQNTHIYQTGIDGAVICTLYEDHCEIYSFKEKKTLRVSF